MISDWVLPLDAFVRSIGVGRATPHAMFLGAGASISSGLPSAQMCIWEWKRDIFLTNNVGLEAQFTELSLVSVRTHIQRWLDRQGLYPTEGDSDEYSVYIEACYPMPESRRLYFQDKVRTASPHIGYDLLGLLGSVGLITSVWTTNFDQLVGRAAMPQGVTPIEIGIDTQHRIVRAAARGELTVVSLHGDYRYDHLKNTTAEVRQQEAQLRESLRDALVGRPMIVCGYSGRDSSIMDTFMTAYQNRGAGTLYWCVQDIDKVARSIHDVIECARAQGHAAHLVPIQGFDDLMVRLSLRCLDDAGRASALQIIESKSAGLDAPRAPFRVDGTLSIAALKSNAFELTCPSEVLAFEPKVWPKERIWDWVRSSTKGKNIVAVPFKGHVCALGTVDELASCFADNIKDRIQRTPLSDADLRYEDGATVSLMRQALVRAMATTCNLATDDRADLWLPTPKSHENIDGRVFGIHDSVRLFIRNIEGKQFLVLKPTVAVISPDGGLADAKLANPIKQRILGWQHNREFNEATNLWRQTLLAGEGTQRVFEYPPACGSTLRFAIRRSPVFAEIVSSTRQPGIQIDPRVRPLFKQKGIELSEPKLVFSNKAGSGQVRDVHPVRGVLANRPFDYPLTVQGFGTELRLGIVCPRAETRILQTYLQHHDRHIQAGKYEADYLPSYPGFQGAFGVRLAIASPGEPGWVTCPEPDGANDSTRVIEVGRSINRAIDMLQAACAPHVVLIFFPERWSQLRGYETDKESFDVHDFVKAASVQKGIGTQFLDQSTVADQLQCRVWWWLSLAFYVKAMRTPWVLDALDKNTAFVGLGMSVKASAGRDRHIVMGCSHIYGSRGEGLQYRLTQVEDPVFYGRNPFLSRDDARRVGEQIRELFFDSREKLPERVVIHKRTRFTRDERQGLREGLSGVRQVDMLEITIDDAYRYVASVADSNGRLREDNYPVRRGTVVRHDDHTALVWVHGVTGAMGGGRRYYQGKRRIPAPLIVHKHAGQSDIQLVAEEILGLSKMNWNTFDLYTKLPATVHSSNEIARIGSLLGRIGSKSYDFRLFI